MIVKINIAAAHGRVRRAHAARAMGLRIGSRAGSRVMQLFLETARIAEVRDVQELGVLDGVVTSPLLAKQERIDYRDCIGRIAELVSAPVFVDLTSHLLRHMVEEAVTLASIAPGVVIKLPTTRPGLKALKQLTRHGIRADMMLCFTAAQAMVGAKAQAAYVSPYIDQSAETPEQAMQLLAQVRRIYGMYAMGAQLIAAPVRSHAHLVAAALAGADAAAVPFAVIDEILCDPAADRRLHELIEQWKQPSPPGVSTLSGDAPSRAVEDESAARELSSEPAPTRPDARVGRVDPL